MMEFARDAGLSAVDLTGMHYNPLTQRYWLGLGTQVNYFAAFKKEAH
jgi:2-polyprenyl-6-hydroxyphenyl methylase/3-demethylubiquinone-9 3-methyltransferase